MNIEDFTCGGVYILRDPYGANLYKIGKANNIAQRVNELMTGRLQWFELHKVIYPLDDAEYNSSTLLYIEKAIHRLLNQYRLHDSRGHLREFFILPEIDATIERLIAIFDMRGFRIGATLDPAHLSAVSEVRPEICCNGENASEWVRSLCFGIATPINAPNAVATPKEHQKAILSIAATHWAAHSRGVLVLAPGYGKSYMSAFIAAQLNAVRILVFAPYDKICSDFGVALMRCEIQNVIIKPNIKDIIENKKEIVAFIITYQACSIYKDLDNFANIKEFDLIIYDEAHHLAASNQWNKSLDIPARRRLFLTATPKIIELDVKCEEIKERGFSMDNQEIYGPIIYRESIEQGIYKGLLCNYKLYVCDHNSGILNICAELIEQHHRKRIILFFNSTETSRTAAELLQTKYGDNAQHIDSVTKENDRSYIFEEFDAVNKEPRIICNVNIISEGANLVLTDAVVFAERRSSSIGIIQAVGRALRVHPTKDIALIVMPKEMDEAGSFIKALSMHDTRVLKKEMYICSRNSEQILKNIYNRCELIEKNSRLRMSTAEFIYLLRSERIDCEYEYSTKYGPIYKEPYVADPEEYYKGFEWHLVPIPSAYYSLEDAKIRISELLIAAQNSLSQINDLTTLEKIKECYSEASKYKILRSMDKKLHPYPLQGYGISSYMILSKNLKISFDL